MPHRNVSWTCLCLCGLALRCIAQVTDDESVAYGAVACEPRALAEQKCPRNLHNDLRDPHEADKVVHGTNAPAGLYPWVVAIVRPIYGGGWNQYCAGSLLEGGLWVLTAAHCDVQQGDFVFVGRQDLLTSEGHQGMVAEVKIPQGAEIPDFKYDAKTHNDDVALLLLDAALPGPYLAIADDKSLESQPDVNMTLVGWGTTSYLGTPANILQRGDVSTLGDTTCTSLYARASRVMTPSMFCAIGNVVAAKPDLLKPVTDACQGDSGGPLLYARSGQIDVVVGIVSWGIGCGKSSYPGVYTRSSSVTPWVCKLIPSLAACTAGKGKQT